MNRRATESAGGEFGEQEILGLEAELASTRRQFLAASLAASVGGAASIGLSGAAAERPGEFA